MISFLQNIRSILTRQLINNVSFGSNVTVRRFVNLYGCSIGDNSRIGTFVEIQRGVSIGKNCKIQSHTFICEGVTIEDNVFVGHGVMFINDNHPQSVNTNGQPESEQDWQNRFVKTVVESGAMIGTHATILGGIKIGKGAIIGAGAVVTKDVAPGATVVGNPAHVLKS